MRLARRRSPSTPPGSPVAPTCFVPHACELAGHDLACECPEGPCHRDVLIDIANPPADPLDNGTSLMGLTVNRQVASMLLVEGFLGGKL